MLSQIKNIIFDYDGVFTDGTISLTDGKFTNSMCVRDISAVRLLHEKGYRLFIINSFKGDNSFRAYVEYVGCFTEHDKGNSDKMGVVKRWMDSYADMSWENTAVIGDDVVDYDLLCNAGFASCPADAVDVVKGVVNHICAKGGGQGCVGEFCRYVMENKHPRVDGLICVKLNSDRLPFKNICSFGNTTLLENKMDTLLTLPFLSSVIVNTESAEIIHSINENVKYKNALKSLRLRIVKRDPYFSQNTTHNADFSQCVMEGVGENVLYSPVTMPFVSTHTYMNMYETFRHLTDRDSVILAAHGSKGAGHEDEKHDLCFAASLLSKQTVKDNKDFIGNRPHFQQCTEKERMDIDHLKEFNDALYCYYNRDAAVSNIPVNESSTYTYRVDKNILLKINFPRVIDVTIRDGGFTNGWDFPLKQVRRHLIAADQIGLEYFELGYFMDECHVKPSDKNPYRMLNVDTIKAVTRGISREHVKLCALIDYWRYDVEQLPPRSETDIDLIRVTTYIETTLEAIEYIKKVKARGYDVSLNVMCGSYLSPADLSRIRIDVLNNAHVLDYLYVADSYGAMTPTTVKEIFDFFQPVRKHVQLGFHVHDNMQIGMANLMASIGLVDIVDASYEGMGRGCGNLKLEDTILYGCICFNDSGLDVYPLFDLIDTDHIRHTIVGLLNIHPYRLRDCKEMHSLKDEFRYLISLDRDSRYKHV